MADDVEFQSAAAATPAAATIVAADEIGGKKHQRVKVQHGADGSATDVSSASPMPTVDSAVATALASLLTELGQKLETGGEVALSAASLSALETIQVGNFPADPATQTTLAAILAKIIAAPATEAKQDTLISAVDGLEGKDYATQTTLAAVLAKIIAAPATEAKQDSILTELGQKLEPGGEVALNAATLSALETIGLDSATLTALETITIGTALPAGTNNIGDVDLASAIPAGTNNIGDVDLASAIPAGSNAIGNVNTAGLSTAAQAGTSVTVGTSSSILVSANSARKLLVVCNDHATNILYVRLGASAAVANQGIRLNAAGGCLTIRGDEYTGEVRAIASGASTVVTVSEV